MRAEWIDVWSFGLQPTIQLRPDEAQGVRHFGVAHDADRFRAVVDRLDRHGAAWLSRPAGHTAAELSGKVGGMLADPSGNIIEIKAPPRRHRPPVGVGAGTGLDHQLHRRGPQPVAVPGPSLLR